MRLRTGSSTTLLALAALTGCHRRVPIPPAGAEETPLHAPVAMVGTPQQRPQNGTPMLDGPDDEPGPPTNAPFSGDAPPLRRCFMQDKTAGGHSLAELLDRAEDRFDKADYQGALDCAEEATREDSDSVEAQHDRAAALAAIGRLDDARRAYSLALALDPEDADTLAGAADFYVNRVGPDHDDTEIGLALARRGEQALRKQVRGDGHADRDLESRVALLCGQALDDLGRSDEALPEIEAALAAHPGDEEALYEKGVALFDLCRFAPAREAFTAVIAKDANDAFAHEHLGLVLEQLGDPTGAALELSRATSLSPKDFPAPPTVSDAEFDALVARAVAGLPPELRASLEKAKLQVTDLPDLSDLLAVDPPFPPTILGLFRGASLGESVPPADPAANRTILLYRRNLLRAVATKDELREQIGVTLLHEIGHLRGEDEDELRARGLE